MRALIGIKACVFDAYGTLFDVHSAVARHRGRLGDRADPLSLTWRTKQLEYTWLRSLMGSYVDFWDVTRDALDFAMEAVEVRDADLRTELMDAYLALDCYDEVKSTLAALQQRGLRNAILSNGSPRMLAAAVESSGIGAYLERTFSVDEIGVYKPDPRVYRLACERLDLDPAEISFQSSNAWDAAGAAHFGMRVAWVNRFGQTRERLPGGPSAELKTLAELPAWIA